MTNRTIAFSVFISVIIFVDAIAQDPAGVKGTDANGEWIQLFNGKDLSGWIPKIRGHKLGDNYANTFRVRDGTLVVSYEDYQLKDLVNMDGHEDGGFDKFGHLFHETPYSHYLLRVEYRFVGEQIEKGPAWAYRNNGLMLHGQDPTKMGINQKFPVSIEVQLLGGNGTDERPTLNLCTPGTHVVMKNGLFKPHCTQSSSKTYHGNQWVAVEVEVRGSELIRHKTGGKTVLEYTQPQYDPTSKDPDATPFIKNGNLLVERGTISLQSESHPTEFRKIELLNLEATQPLEVIQ